MHRAVAGHNNHCIVADSNQHSSSRLSEKFWPSLRTSWAGLPHSQHGIWWRQQGVDRGVE